MSEDSKNNLGILEQRYSVTDFFVAIFSSLVISGIFLSLFFSAGLKAIVFLYGALAFVFIVASHRYPKVKLISQLMVVYWILGTILAVIVLNSEISEETPKESANTTFECTRTEPYPMPEEFKRALSLRNQRLSESGGGFIVEAEKKYANCFNIQYGDLRLVGGADGLFSYDKNSTANDLRITVDNVFRFNDDILLATLLHHEITHATNYMDVQQGLEEPLSCTDDEKIAFWEQYNFTRALNPGERDSLIARANNLIKGQDNNQYSSSSLSILVMLYKAMQDNSSWIQSCNQQSTQEQKDICRKVREQTVIRKILVDSDYCAGRQ